MGWGLGWRQGDRRLTCEFFRSLHDNKKQAGDGGWGKVRRATGQFVPQQAVERTVFILVDFCFGQARLGMATKQSTANSNQRVR